MAKVDAEKSTLLNMIGGIETPDKGSIIVNGFDVAKKEKSRNISKKLLDFYFKILPFWKTKQ